MNAWDNRYVRPGRFSVVGPAPIVEVEPLSGPFPRRRRLGTLVAAPVQGQREGVINIPDRAPAPLRAHPPIRRSTPAVAVAPLHSPSRREVLPRRAPANVAIRKPLTNPCYICYEAFEGLDDATFCRARCGQNVHRECFEQWIRGKERDQVTCSFWFVTSFCMNFGIVLIFSIA